MQGRRPATLISGAALAAGAVDHPQWNVLKGTAMSGATGGPYRWCGMEGDARSAQPVYWKPRGEGVRPFENGEEVSVRIAIDDVCLADLEWTGVPDGWNRWIGRVVWVEREVPVPFVTVKVVGAAWTVMSRGQVLGLSETIQVWDYLLVLVDPVRVFVRPPFCESANPHLRLLRCAG